MTVLPTLPFRFDKCCQALLLGLGLTTLAGCGGMMGESSDMPRESFYRLDIPSDATPMQRPWRGVAEITRFRADGVLSDRALSYTEDGLEMNQYSYHAWVEPLPTHLQMALADFLRASAAFENVVTPDLRVSPDYSVLGRIIRFDHIVPNADLEAQSELQAADNTSSILQTLTGAPSTPTPTAPLTTGPASVDVALEFVLIEERSNKVLLTEVYRDTRPAADMSISAAVQAMRGATHDIMARFLADLDAYGS
ncbi:MAG: ABC-type transport auxiliary lipoprotein family protein [Rhodospirillaceae bacterium]